MPFTCPCCTRVSHHPKDLEQGWCAACDWWTADPVLGPPHLGAPCTAREETTQADDLTCKTCPATITTRQERRNAGLCDNCLQQALTQTAKNLAEGLNQDETGAP